MNNKSEEYREGYQAARDHSRIDENPYYEGDVQYDDWKAGFKDGMAQRNVDQLIGI